MPQSITPGVLTAIISILLTKDEREQTMGSELVDKIEPRMQLSIDLSSPNNECQIRQRQILNSERKNTTSKHFAQRVKVSTSLLSDFCSILRIFKVNTQ